MVEVIAPISGTYGRGKEKAMKKKAYQGHAYKKVERKFEQGVFQNRTFH